MPKPSKQGLAKIKQALRKAKTERGWIKYDQRWLIEASKILDPKGDWDSNGLCADGCSEGTWKRFVDNKESISSLPFQAFCKVLELDWREIIDTSNNIHQVFESNLELKIGLSSEASNIIGDLLKDFEYIINAFLPKSFPRPNFNIIELGNEEARKKFRTQGLYDIIMLDDPWIPTYLNDIDPLNSYLTELGFNSETLFGQVFLKSFQSVCIHGDQIVGLPVLGNVQLLIHRRDVASNLSNQIGNALFDRELLHLNLDVMEDFYSIVQSVEAINKKSYSAVLNAKYLPLVVRDDSNGNKVEVFWEILRALDHEDRVDQDAVIIDLNIANRARSWLYDFTCRLNFSDLHSSLLARSSNISTALGWPGWITGALSKNPLALDEIEFQRFSKAHPVMGAWCLALPHYPAQPELREYAVRVMLALTTDPNIQFLLAKRGNIPVLADFSEKIEPLRQIPFWRANYDKICSALADSLPRPRTKYWNDIEKELNLQIYKGEFKDIPEKLVFLDSSSTHTGDFRGS